MVTTSSNGFIKKSGTKKSALGEEGLLSCAAMMKERRDKLLNAIIFFADRTHHCSKDKVIQLLYIFDFTHYRQTSQSVTGLEYFAWERGPIPQKLYLEFDAPGKDLQEAVYFSTDQMWNYFLYSISPKKDFDPSCFSEREHKLLEQIATQYRDAFAGQMFKITQAKNGAWDRVWRGGKGRFDLIPYELARINEAVDALRKQSQGHEGMQDNGV